MTPNEPASDDPVYFLPASNPQWISVGIASCGFSPDLANMSRYSCALYARPSVRLNSDAY